MVSVSRKIKGDFALNPTTRPGSTSLWQSYSRWWSWGVLVKRLLAASSWKRSSLCMVIAGVVKQKLPLRSNRLDTHSSGAPSLRRFLRPTRHCAC